MSDYFICPFCLEKHSKKDCVHRCMSNSACRHGVNLQNNNIIPSNSLKVCQNKCDQRFIALCPNSLETGGKVIPTRAMSQSMSIALLGGRNSGKSNYIAVLVNEIKRKMSSVFKCSLMPCDDTTQSRYEDYFYNPIFNKHMALPSTDAGRLDPLLFTLDFNKKTLFGKSIESLLVPLYDTAGENTNSEEALVENVGYIQNAGGIILLLDPFEIDEIASRLEDNNIPKPVNAQKMESILNRIQNVLQRGNNSKIIDIPIAIVLTKLDLLLNYTKLIDSDSVLRKESSHLLNGYFSNREFQAVDNAVRDILRGSTDAQNLFERLEIFKNAAFFAVTSFGCDPTLGDLKKEMKPMRVLDPLLWLLSVKGYIKTGK